MAHTRRMLFVQAITVAAEWTEDHMYVQVMGHPFRWVGVIDGRMEI